jgi:hypothetical protein
MPLLSTLSNAGIQSYGNRGIITGGSAFYDSIYDSLNVSAGTAFQYGTGDFTIEMWFYPTTANGIAGNGVTLFSQRGPNYNSQRYLFLFLWPTGQIYLQVAGNDFFVGTVNTVTLNAWNHVALVRRSGIMTIFLNGYPGNSRINITNFSDASAYIPIFGSLGFNVQYAFSGYMSNMRIAKSAYYSIPFEPDRTPFTRTSQGATNVQLLLNFKNAAGLLTDSSANNVTVFNSTLSLVQYNALTPFNVPYVPNPLVTPVSATVTPSTLTPSEGSTITFTVAGTNTPNGNYYYVVEEPTGLGTITSTDFTSGALSGTFSISGNSGSFPLTVSRDLTTEGVETFAVSVRSTSITGQILGTSDEITITDSSLTPSFTVAPSNVNEGSTASFTVENVGADGTYFWTVLNGTTASADFSAVSGSFAVSGSTGGLDNGTGSFSITTVSDRVTEGSQTFQVQVRSGSVSGTVVLTSSAITINDISLTPFANFTNNSTIAELTGNNGGYATSTTLQVGNLGPAGTYYWSIVDNQGTMTASDLTAGSITGSFTTSTLNGSANLTFTAAPDTVAETSNGLNNFQVQIREGSTSGTILTTSGPILLYDSSVVISLLEPNPASEGNGFNITVSTNLFQSLGVAPGLYFLTFESTGSATAADVAGLPFAFNITSQGNYGLNGVVSVVSLDGAEGSETFRIGVRQGTTTGPLVGLSPIITINASIT